MTCSVANFSVKNFKRVKKVKFVNTFIASMPNAKSTTLASRVYISCQRTAHKVVTQ